MASPLARRLRSLASEPFVFEKEVVKIKILIIYLPHKITQDTRLVQFFLHREFVFGDLSPNHSQPIMETCLPFPLRRGSTTRPATGNPSR